MMVMPYVLQGKLRLKEDAAAIEFIANVEFMRGTRYGSKTD